MGKRIGAKEYLSNRVSLLSFLLEHDFITIKKAAFTLLKANKQPISGEQRSWLPDEGYKNVLQFVDAEQGPLRPFTEQLKVVNPPAPLEDIIDSAVKTGADLSQIVLWNYAKSREILESGTPIPSLPHKRLSIDWSDRENRPPLPRATGVARRSAHWLDRLEAGVKAG